MRRTLASVVIFALGVTASGSEPAPTPRLKSDRAEALAAAIDRHLSRAWSIKGVVPAAPADDAEFLRRVYLDLTGRTPRVPESRAFLADTTPDKRKRLVE